MKFWFETKKPQKCSRFLVKLVQQINFTLPAVFLTFPSLFSILFFMNVIKTTRKSGLAYYTFHHQVQDAKTKNLNNFRHTKS